MSACPCTELACTHAGIVPKIELGIALYAILGAATVIKVALYGDARLFCAPCLGCSHCVSVNIYSGMEEAGQVEAGCALAQCTAWRCRRRQTPCWRWLRTTATTSSATWPP